MAPKTKMILMQPVWHQSGMGIQELGSKTKINMKDYLQMALVKLRVYNLGGLFCKRVELAMVMLPIYIIPGKFCLGQNWEEVNCP